MSNQNTLPATADSLARLYTAEAVGTVVEVMRGAIGGKEAKDRLQAAQVILDRGHGKAVQATIAVPTREALTRKLAALTDDELLEIARRGRGMRNEGPVPPGAATGTHQDHFAHPSQEGARSADSSDYEPPSDDRPAVTPPPPRSKALVRLPFGHEDVADGIDEDDDLL